VGAAPSRFEGDTKRVGDEISGYDLERVRGGELRK